MDPHKFEDSQQEFIFKPGARLVLEIDPVHERQYVCVCVCVSAPEAINNQWRDVV